MRLTRRALLMATTLAATAPVRAQSPSDARVKARLALVLARFTQWPAAAFAGPAEPLVLCVLNRSDTLGAAFGELAGQPVAGRPVKVVEAPDRPAAGCHVLFVHESAERGGTALAGLLAAAGAAPVLTIGDAEGFSSRGGMVELVNVNDTMRLDVNLKSLRAAQLSLSSQVLKLARQVRE